MNVRMLNINDAEDYRNLRLKGLRTDPSAFGSTYELESTLPIEKFGERLICSNEQFVVGGLDEDQLVCVASFIQSGGPKSSHKGFLQAMYCDKVYRGKGIARDVVTYLIDKTKEIEGVEQLSLSVVAENVRAKAFYEAFGFETYGTEPRAMFDGKKYYDEHKMVLQL